MKIILAIGAGSFIGGILRYLVAKAVQSRFLLGFPFGTLTVNLVGCLLIGMLYGLTDRGTVAAEWRLFLATGVLGGFTTFSAFSMETVMLFREGEPAHAIAYAVGSVILGIAGTFAGYGLVKFL